MKGMELMKVHMGNLHAFTSFISQEPRTPLRYECRTRLYRMTATAQISPPHRPSVTATAVS